jgi:hypothetical protein
MGGQHASAITPLLGRAKLARMGMDAYIAEKKAELDPIIDAHIAELKEQQKSKKGV